jgi:hypothetical protein
MVALSFDGKAIIRAWSARDATPCHRPANIKFRSGSFCGVVAAIAHRCAK